MRKKFSVIFILLAFIITIGCFSGYSKPKVFADEIINTASKSAYLIDANTNTVIYANNENERLPIASMCKIMTLILCFDALNSGEICIDEMIKVSDNAAGMGGSQVFLESNAEYSVGEMIKGIVVASANDACVAMAERLYGSENTFVEKMNDKAKELGMANTVFTNCTGLPKAGQYSCAKDVSIMFSELIKNKDYFRFSKIWTDVIKHPNNRITEIANTNKLIRFYQGCDGGKTGYTSEAGHCLVASAFRNGMRLIAVVISAPNSKIRFKDVTSMFDYGFANYVNKIVIDDKKPLELNVSVEGGKKDTIEVRAEKPFVIFSRKDEHRSVEIDFVPDECVRAPIKIGEKVGVINVYENGIEIGSISVLANENIEEMTYFDIIQDIGEKWALA